MNKRGIFINSGLTRKVVALRSGWQACGGIWRVAAPWKGMAISRRCALPCAPATTPSTPSRVVLYTTAVCPYCVRAKTLLQRKGVAYEEVRIEGNRELIREMIERTGRRTVPQIFVGDRHVGGYDDLAGLEALGALDSLLGLAPQPEHAYGDAVDCSDDSPT
jgi:glutaredoxin 3